MLAWDNRDASGRCLYNNGTGVLRLLRNLAVVTVSCDVLGWRAGPINFIRCFPGTTRTRIGPVPLSGRETRSPPARTRARRWGRPRLCAGGDAQALAQAGNDGSLPWQNPETGAGGNVTPFTVSYNEGGLFCRYFLASYVHAESQDWLQGAAYRTSAGKWEVARLKPLS